MILAVLNQYNPRTVYNTYQYCYVNQTLHLPTYNTIEIYDGKFIAYFNK